ncbi:MAG TPA: hypothetical protein VD994_10020, partial [Prosthecobacter sp.]|nr:hypothetical protein [Prosthecobacter sp.]
VLTEVNLGHWQYMGTSGTQTFIITLLMGVDAGPPNPCFLRLTASQGNFPENQPCNLFRNNNFPVTSVSHGDTFVIPSTNTFSDCANVVAVKAYGGSATVTFS